MLRTGQLLGPAPHPASRPRTGALLPGTLASPRTGLPPAGCRELVARLRHEIVSSLTQRPSLLDAQQHFRVSPFQQMTFGTPCVGRFVSNSCPRLAVFGHEKGDSRCRSAVRYSAWIPLYLSRRRTSLTSLVGRTSPWRVRSATWASTSQPSWSVHTGHQSA